MSTPSRNDEYGYADDILETQYELAQAVGLFYEECQNFRDNLKVQEEVFAEREAAIEEKQRLLDEMEKEIEKNERTADKMKQNNDLLAEERFKRREAYLLNLKKKLETESEFQAIGRKQIVKDLKNHQIIIDSARVELQLQAEQEREEIVEDIVEDLKGLKLFV